MPDADTDANSHPLPPRSRAALLAGKVAAEASRYAGLGSGSVIGGRLSLAIDSDLLISLAAGRDIALVSATNGKTTTTALLAAALAGDGPVATNTLGANMPPGLVAALAEADPAAKRAVLEVDERWLPAVLRAMDPATVLLLNLSRDQLDRSHEVRKIADIWRSTLASQPTRCVVANADDPLVVWAAGGGDDAWTAGAEPRPATTNTSGLARPVWVGTAAHWTNDASGCPRCGGRIRFTRAPDPSEPPAPPAPPGMPAPFVAPGPDSWHCTQCGLAKPTPDWWLGSGSDGRPVLARRDGPPIPLDVALPGRVNAANGAMVVAAAAAMGTDPSRAARRLAEVTEVAGRYRRATISGTTLQMLLAKNPAGWQEAIDMLGPAPQPVVASINARIADGRDPSWLWDVPFERLRGRFVVALGERRHDLAVRLRYAEVDHAVASSLTEGLARAAASPDASGAVDLIANYTAFQDYRVEVARLERSAPASRSGENNASRSGENNASRSGENHASRSSPNDQGGRP